jgi:ACS family hexuronate transporter-like MFS transporter
MSSSPGMPATVTRPPSGARLGRYRWYICGLLFFASAINYVDRQVIAILKPDLQAQFGWSEIDYSDIVFAFQLAYAIGLVAGGWLMDRLGARIGFTLAIVVWSLAAMAHAGVDLFGPGAAAVLGVVGLTYSASVAGFITARFALGLGESGNFPAAIKTVAEWFPSRERAFATGIFNAGTNVGALVAPIAVPWLTVAYGWRTAFLATGALGFGWVGLWWVMYRSPASHPRVTAAELEYIQDRDVSTAPAGRIGPPDEHAAARAPWKAIVRRRQTWAFAAGKFLTDPVWSLYLFWIPDYLHRNHGLDLLSLGPPIVIIYLMADVGSVAGGWLSSSLIARGWTVNASRKLAMFVCALAVVPVVFAAQTTHLWLAVGLIGIAAAAHQGWSCNLFTLTSDMFPGRAVGSVVGFGGMMGALGTMVMAKVTGNVLELTGSYVVIFLIAGFAYLVALGVIHLLAPRLEQASID